MERDPKNGKMEELMKEILPRGREKGQEFGSEIME